MITVYYPTLIARICGWMSADLFNHIIHVSFTAYPFFFLYAVYTRCFREINYAVLETERYTLPGIIYNFITYIFLIHYQNSSNIPILWYIKRDALESGNIGYKSVKLTKAKNRTFSYREVAFPPLLIFHRIISGGVNCIHYQQGTKVLFSSMFIPELRGSADNDNSSWCFAPSVSASVRVYHKRAGRKVAFTQCGFLVVSAPPRRHCENTPRGGPLENHQRHDGR